MEKKEGKERKPCIWATVRYATYTFSIKLSMKTLRFTVVNPFQDNEGNGGKKAPPTSFPHVAFTNVGISII